jgi:protease-4
VARRRDIIIAIVIAVTAFITIGFFGLIFIGLYFGDEDISLGGFGDKVAVIEVYDGIYDSQPVVRQLKKWGEAGSVRAIVLHINSPGGAVAPSQEIFREILHVREENNKIVVVSMSSIAASGAYMISCAADRIMANPGTLTGSIGVIFQFPVAGELFEKIGITYEKVKSGELKDVGALDRRMTSGERKMLSAMVMDTYEQFIDIVAEGRQMERNEVYALADGSVFTGRQAYELGLVDTLGGFEEAVEMAADMAGIYGRPRIIKEFRPKKNIWDLLGTLVGRVEEKAFGDASGPQVLYLY